MKEAIIDRESPEPWRDRAFPLIRDLVVERRSLDRIPKEISVGFIVQMNRERAPGATSLTHGARHSAAHARIIVRIILKRLSAFSACGWLAGIRISSPAFRALGLPAMVISASPSSIWTRAS